MAPRPSTSILPIPCCWPPSGPASLPAQAEGWQETIYEDLLEFEEIVKADIDQDSEPNYAAMSALPGHREQLLSGQRERLYWHYPPVYVQFAGTQHRGQRGDPPEIV